MLKSEKGHSLAGVTLFCLTFLLGLFFRLYRLEEVSAWNAEVTALYFANHLDRVFFHHNLPPFFSFLGRLWISFLPETILSLRYLSVFLSTLVASWMSVLLWKKKGSDLTLLLLILFWLSPLGILFSRQAGPWGLINDLTLLIIVLWTYRGHIPKYILWPVWTVYQLLHPLSLAVVWLLAVVGFIRKKTTAFEFKFFITTSLIPLGYYLLRFIFMGKNFLGELYPKAGPVPPWFPPGGQVLFALLVIGTIFYFLKKSHLSIGIVLFLILGLANLELVYFTKAGVWDDQSVARFRQLQPILKPKELVICASAPQLDYYFGHAYKACSTEVLRLHLKRQSFYLYSLAGDDDLLISFLKKSTKVEQEIKIGHGLLLSIKYPKSKISQP